MVGWPTLLSAYLILNFDIHPRAATGDRECRLIVAGWGKKCCRVVRRAEALDGKADPVFVEFPVAIFIVVGRGGVDAGLREDHAELYGSLLCSEALLEDFLSLDEKVLGFVPVQDERHVAPVVTKAADAYVDIDPANFSNSVVVGGTKVVDLFAKALTAP